MPRPPLPPFKLRDSAEMVTVFGWLGSEDPKSFFLRRAPHSAFGTYWPKSQIRNLTITDTKTKSCTFLAPAWLVAKKRQKIV